ncbi:hypothetical protein FB451DRAFT_1292367 [Mycena latifolia]|nr:hypothetical protein FB451DRAFT_1292367 [Mycena latifolia]
MKSATHLSILLIAAIITFPSVSANPLALKIRGRSGVVPPSNIVNLRDTQADNGLGKRIGVFFANYVDDDEDDGDASTSEEVEKRVFFINYVDDDEDTGESPEA